MIQSKNAGHAKAYFQDALSKSDYFISDQELPGFWQGKLAARLGLAGETTKEAFYALCDNRHPVTGLGLTPRTREERTTGYDINFHCPKSVSILHAFAKDDHILKAFQESVTETMRAIEAASQTRVRQSGVYADRSSGELVWGHFTHQTARPVEGALPDPHLHSHCYVFNATFDAAENRIKAGQFRDIQRNMPYYQSRFHKTLADKLAQLGYGIRMTGKSFEVEYVPEAVIDLFSKRTDEIGRIAKEKGITDAKELGELGARTRAKKDKGYGMAELKDAWREQVMALGEAGKGDSTAIVRNAPVKEAVPCTAQQCLDHAVKHCFERASVVPDRKLLETAFKYSIGKSVKVEDIERALKEDSRIIRVEEKGRMLCTTREVLTEEKRMVSLARAGQGVVTPLYEAAPETSLNGQQAAAVAHVLTTTHRISIIRGAAGAGKTTLMKEAVPKIEATGKIVTVVAPSSDAARGVLKGAGFDNAETVARLLIDEKMQANLKGQVLWVDEAGLLGTKDMLSLLELTQRMDARLILGGDTRQHASVVRGDALRILNTVAGIRTAEVSKIYRQKNEDYRNAVDALSKGDIKRGFEKLDDIGFIKEIDPMKPNGQMVDDYMVALKKGKDTLMVCPTHAQGEAATEEIRNRLRSDGLLGKKEVTARQLKNLNLTEAEKRDSRNLRDGQIVQFTQNVRGFVRGSLWTVKKDEVYGIMLTDTEGMTKPLPMERSQHYSLFELRDIKLSIGDKVRITDNCFDLNRKRLNNGATLEVTGVTVAGEITLKNKNSKESYHIDKGFGHIAHAHCITSHASQGKDVDEVFIYQPQATFGATNAKQFYVSVSRGKERAHIYTDSKAELLEHASELGDRTSALELTGRDRLHRDFTMQLQREKEKEHELTKDKDYDYGRE